MYLKRVSFFYGGNYVDAKKCFERRVLLFNFLIECIAMRGTALVTRTAQIARQKAERLKTPFNYTPCLFIHHRLKFACQGETDVKLPSHIMGFTVCARTYSAKRNYYWNSRPIIIILSLVPHFNSSQFWVVPPHYPRWYSSLCEVNHFSRADHFYTNVGLHFISFGVDYCSITI